MIDECTVERYMILPGQSRQKRNVYDIWYLITMECVRILMVCVVGMLCAIVSYVWKWKQNLPPVLDPTQ